MTPQRNSLKHKLSDQRSIILMTFLVFIVIVFSFLSRQEILASKQEFDRRNIQALFADLDFDNDVILDTVLLTVAEPQEELVYKHLLGLRRDRLAYRAREQGEVVAIAVPATAEDGFNGYVDLLIAIDMYGHISAARVIEDINSDEIYGVIDVIDSQWMKQFSGNTMRDILGTSWKKISAENEYDQFVGASITPKTVSKQIYDALVFFQSNRIALMRGGF